MTEATRTRPRRTYKYPALSFRQRGVTSPGIILFHAPVSEILDWATVEELTPTTTGAQRQKHEAKVEGIAKFLRADAQNAIPTAVIVAFDSEGATFSRNRQTPPFGKLSVNIGVRAAIVDGQHRLHGMMAFDPKIAVAVVGLLNADPVEKAFQFLVINNKGTRVPVKHTKALLARMKQTELGARLRAARLAFDAEGIKDVDLVNSDADGPFFETIDWPTTPESKRMVQATAIEASLAYMAGLGVAAFEDRDVRRSVFLAMWSVVRKTWSSLWKPESRLVSKVGVVCLTRFLSDTIVTWSDNEELQINLSDLKQIEQQTKKILRHMDAKFWTAAWSEKASGGFDTTQGRERVTTALRQLHRNGRNGADWYTDIEIIDSSSLAPQRPRKRQASSD